MAFSAARLRKWFAFAAVAVIAVVAGSYYYARYRVQQQVEQIPQRLGVEVQQSTEGFTLSRSEGGRTLFTVRAARAVQLREGGRAELKDVSIIVFGRRADRYDQIQGSDFVYDPASGEVTADGEVRIVLQAHDQGPQGPDQAPPEQSDDAIEVKTSGLVFNHKTGVAATERRLEFRLPQASGSAQGATYDARSNRLTLGSSIRARIHGDEPATVSAEHGIINAQERRAELQQVQAEQGQRRFRAERLHITLREDHTVEQMLASGGVRAVQSGATSAEVRAPRAVFDMQPENQLRQITLSGGVALESDGAESLRGQAEQAVVEFGAGNRVQQVRTRGNVRLARGSAQGQPVEVAAEGIDWFLRDGAIERAVTAGEAQIVLAEGSGLDAGRRGRTVIKAGGFEADFDEQQLRLVQGKPEARIVSSAPGRPDRVTTSEEITVRFAAGGRLASFTQTGSFRYEEGSRVATAEQARYDAAEERITLSGSPRLTENGLTATARTMRVEPRTGDAVAEGDVKTTYADLRQQPGGALLAAAEPVHATADRLLLKQSEGVARFTGGARLWQGANIVQAPTIEFRREQRIVEAQGSPGERVSTVFVQPDAKGQATPVNITAGRLSYSDQQRRARFEGGVVLRGADLSMTAGHVDVFLLAQGGAAAGGEPAAPSRIQRVVAEGDLVIQQGARRATGERLVYTPEDGKFVLSGGLPSIFDAEHGKIQGRSLTFFSRDDRVLVEGGASRAVTQTRVRQ